MKRYEVTKDDQTFVILKEYNNYDIFLVTADGLTQSERYYTKDTKIIIKKIYENIEKYTVAENEITNVNYHY